MFLPEGAEAWLTPEVCLEGPTLGLSSAAAMLKPFVFESGHHNFTLCWAQQLVIASHEWRDLPSNPDFTYSTYASYLTKLNLIASSVKWDISGPTSD